MTPSSDRYPKPEKFSQVMQFAQIGRWRDTITWVDGTVDVGPWHHNQVQDASATLIGLLMRETIEGAMSSFSGINFLAIGEGDPSWDLGTPAQPRTDTTLESEIDRFAVAPPDDIIYLNPSTLNPQISPSKVIEVNTTIPFSVTGDLREFGLFGGDADSTANSGYMVNWIVHTKIEKTTQQSIQRTIQITWLTFDECAAL